MTPDIKSRIDALTPDAGLQHVPAKAGQAEEFHTLVRRSDMHAAIEAVLGARSTAARPVEPIAEGLLQSACARMLANANWSVAGALSPASKRKDFPSNGWASVKLRDLASVRDTLSAASGDSTPPSEPVTDGMVAAFTSFAKKATHLHHPDVPYLGVFYGDSEEEWQSRVIKAALTVALNARVQGDPSGALRPEPEAVGQGRWIALSERLPPACAYVWLAWSDTGDVWESYTGTRSQDIRDEGGCSHWMLKQAKPLPPQAASVERGD